MAKDFTPFEKQLLDTIQSGFDGVNKRLDALVENTGKHWRDHEKRLKEHETRLARLERKAS